MRFLCHIDDNDSFESVDPGARRTSTPVKVRRKLASQYGSGSDDGSNCEKRQRGAKHDLTPGSKQHPSEPKSKRFLVGMSIFLMCSFEDLSCIIVFWFSLRLACLHPFIYSL